MNIISCHINRIFRVVGYVLLLAMLIGFTSALKSQTLVSFQGSQLYLTQIDSNKKLIIFLHGGVTNPYFNQSADKITPDFLLENNRDFASLAIKNGYDVIMPITNPKINWVDYYEETYSFLTSYIKSIGKSYHEIYITGFSDGGTGSYKIFYMHPEYFTGLIVFNGYPQHANFYKRVNYNRITDKRILFFGTNDDQTIPYEFLLTEYCHQKSTNPNTFFYLAKGDHSFGSYLNSDLQLAFEILQGKNSNKDTIPLQGFIRNDQLITLYPFRKKIVRLYNFGQDIFEENKKQLKEMK